MCRYICHRKSGFCEANIDMEDYVVIGRIGEGAHGVVMKGRHKQSGRIVALKKVLLKRLEDGIPATALREIKALQVWVYSLLWSRNQV